MHYLRKVRAQQKGGATTAFGGNSSLRAMQQRCGSD
jgi:hypothetical protein